MTSTTGATTEDYDYLIKLLALGDSSVGKTCLLQRYISDAFSTDFGNTVGVDFKQKTVVYKPKEMNGIIEKESRLLLQLWDTAGQERFKSLTVSFFRDAMGFLLVFDLTDEKSFAHVRDWIGLLKNHSYCESPDIVLVGNKKDLTAKRVVSEESAMRVAKEFNIRYIETSASSGENVDKVYETLIELVMERISKVIDKSLLPVKKKGQQAANKKEDGKCSC